MLLAVSTILIIWLSVGGMLTVISMFLNANSNPDAIMELNKDAEEKKTGFLRDFFGILMILLFWPIQAHTMLKARKNGCTPLEQIAQDKMDRDAIIKEREANRIKQEELFKKLQVEARRVLKGETPLLIEWRAYEGPLSEVPLHLRVAVFVDENKQPKNLITHFVKVEKGVFNIYRGIPDSMHKFLSSSDSLMSAMGKCEEDTSWLKLFTPTMMKTNAVEVVQFLLEAPNDKNNCS